MSIGGSGSWAFARAEHLAAGTRQQIFVFVTVAPVQHA